MDAAPPPLAASVAAGSPAFLRIVGALAGVGVSTFALLYCLQPLLPTLAAAFHLDAAQASLAVSGSTLGLALALIPAGIVADRIGRKRIIGPALLLAAALTVAAAYAPDWRLLVALRALAGAALAGAPAAAMAYIGEEIEPPAAGSAMGLYIGATAFGGMAGRLGAGFAAEALGWRGAVLATGLAGLAAACAVILLLPKARRFQPQRRPLAQIPREIAGAFTRPGLALLFVEAFLLMGGFVTVFNYGGFRLSAPPYRLGPAAVGAVFSLYLAGVVSASLFGRWIGRSGHGAPFLVGVGLVLAGATLTLATPLWALVGALGVVTFGFFGAHATASGWVGKLAGAGRAQAAALYLVFYYLGSSLLGSAGGVMWERAGWSGVAGFVIALTALALAIAVRLQALVRERGG